MRWTKQFGRRFWIGIGLWAGLVYGRAEPSPSAAPSTSLHFDWAGIGTNSATEEKGSGRPRNEVEEELAQCRRALARNPFDETNVWRAGRCYFMLSNYAEAKSYFAEYARLEPYVGQAHYWLGWCAFEMNDAKTAEKEYLQCTKLEPGYMPAYNAAAQTADWAENKAQAHFWLGWALFRAGKTDRAIRELEEARREPPYRVATTYYLLAAYLRAGRFWQAFQAHPLLWSWYVMLILNVTGGCYFWATTLCLKRADAPGIGAAFLWLVFFFASEMAWMLAAGLLPGMSPQEIMILGMTAGPLPLLWLALTKFSKMEWGQAYQPRLRVGARVWGLACVVYFIMLFVDHEAKAAHLLPPQRAAEFLRDALRYCPGWVFVCSVLVVPLAEEILCRGLLFGAVQRRWGLWAVPVSSAVFAAYHFDPPHFIPLFAMGLILGWLRQVSGGIWASYVAHAANNGIALLVMTAAGR